VGGSAAETATFRIVDMQCSGGTVKGIVLDDNTHEALKDVVVAVDGTTNGTATDVDGNFTLSNVAAGSTLVVAYLGYTTLRVAAPCK